MIYLTYWYIRRNLKYLKSFVQVYLGQYIETIDKSNFFDFLKELKSCLITDYTKQLGDLTTGLFDYFLEEGILVKA